MARIPLVGLQRVRPLATTFQRASTTAPGRGPYLHLARVVRIQAEAMATTNTEFKRVIAQVVAVGNTAVSLLYYISRIRRRASRWPATT